MDICVESSTIVFIFSFSLKTSNIHLLFHQFVDDFVFFFWRLLIREACVCLFESRIEVFDVIPDLDESSLFHFDVLNHVWCLKIGTSLTDTFWSFFFLPGKSPIEKLNDGSCNHIRCAICTCEFCWLCMKEVDNLHFITPTGCTFYGKHRWSRGRSIMILILLWIFTPLILLLMLIVLVPILLFFLPITMTKKFYRFTIEAEFECCRKTWSTILICILAILLTPLILALIIVTGVPLLIFFVYLYMPKRYITANF